MVCQSATLRSLSTLIATVAALVVLRAAPVLAVPSCPALYLNGTSAYARAAGTIYPNTTAFVSFTAEAWVFPTVDISNNSTRVLLSDDAFDLVWQRDQFSNSRVGMILYGPSGVLYGGNQIFAININQWNHVALIFNAATRVARVSVNGVLGPSITISGSFGSFLDAFTIGSALGPTPANLFTGYIDNVRISDSVRYSTNFTPSDTFVSDANTRALFTFSEAPGSTTFADSSTYNNTLTAFGGADALSSPSCSAIAPTITVQPTGQWSRLLDPIGGSAVRASFSVGVNGAPAPGLQWQRSRDGGLNWNDIVNDATYSGVTTQTLSVLAGPSTNGALFRCVATNAGGSAVSRGAVLHVGGPGFDVDSDGLSEVVVYRPSTGSWFVRYSSGNYAGRAYQWGNTGDQPVIGDFDGDTRTDLTVYRPTTGEWYIRYSSRGFDSAQAGYYQWGTVSDTPVPADFDADGITDIAFYRPGDGTWNIRYSSFGFAIGAGPSPFAWGAPGDRPMVGDFDGDARTDITVYRPASGQWFIRLSSLNYDPGQFGYFEWGLSGASPIAADFDGDGLTDPAFYLGGWWYLRYSSQGYAGVYSQWGATGDVPAVRALIGAGRARIGVYRPSTGEWFGQYSPGSTGVSDYFQWGATGDVPIAIQ